MKIYENDIVEIINIDSTQRQYTNLQVGYRYFVAYEVNNENEIDYCVCIKNQNNIQVLNLNQFILYKRPFVNRVKFIVDHLKNLFNK